MEFNHGIELLQLCEKTGLPISQIMKKREAVFSGITEEEVDAKMRKALEIMKQSVKEPLDAPTPSIGGLIGGEARKLHERREQGKSICGTLLSKVITYAWQCWR